MQKKKVMLVIKKKTGQESVLCVNWTLHIKFAFEGLSAARSFFLQQNLPETMQRGINIPMRLLTKFIYHEELDFLIWDRRI